ncbi:MAG: transposase [Chlorobium sp.]|jgi:transposase|nr:transposase [Chlorobium sp.]
MEIRKRRKFTDEYKQDVVRILEEKEMPIKELAKDMGLGVDLLYSWRRRYGKDNHNIISKEDDSAEVKKLIKRLREVEEERDILKKAMAIFTQPTKPGIGS